MRLSQLWQCLWQKRKSIESHIPRASLAVDALPELLDPLPLGCNTALWGTEIPHMQIWQQSILQELLIQSRVFLIAIDESQAKCLLHNKNINYFFKKNRLNIFLLDKNAQLKIAKNNGLADFLDELNNSGLKHDHSFICLNIFHLIKNTEIKQISKTGAILKNWAKKRKQPSVWFFNYQEEFIETNEYLNFLYETFPYAATLQKDRSGINLLINRWSTSKGSIFQTRFGIEPNPTFDKEILKIKCNGTVIYSTGNRHNIVANDIETVYTTQACVNEIRLLPPEWIVVPNWDELEIVCKDAIASTVMIDAGTTKSFKKLGHLVHRLRQGHPSSLKIVIQETKDHLRIHTEEALSQLGANTIIHKGMQFSRIVRRIHELKHTWYYEKASANVDEVFRNLEPIDDSGYKNTDDFCNTLDAFLRNPARAALSHSLVKLNLLPSVSHLTALKELRLNRDGEIFTNNKFGILIFLYACREADMHKVLERIFKQPIESLFQSQESFHAIDDMLYEIRKTKISLQNETLPDYSIFLKKEEKKPIQEVFEKTKDNSEMPQIGFSTQAFNITQPQEQKTKSKLNWKKSKI